ncbi:MAG: PilW family protein [Gammaproteobacteria bacterium]
MNPNPTTARRRIARTQTGLSLVEIMIAMVIGLILTAGVIQLFIGSKQTYRFQDGLSRTQENARFALEALNSDIRMAGNLGCTAFVQNVNTLLNAPPASFNPQAGIQGWEAAGTAPGNSFNLPAETAAVVDASGGSWSTAGGAILDAATLSVPGSDILRIWRGDGRAGRIDATSTTTGANIDIVTMEGIAFNDGDILLLSDCENADWVQMCGGGGCTPGNTATAILTRPGTDSTVMRIQSYIYYVGKRNDATDSPPGLFRRPLGVTGGNGAAAGAAEEVVEGVENMQVLYGVDTNANRIVDNYVTANNVSNWNNVVSVQIALLMRATERGDDISGAATYTLAGTDANAANDRRLRQIVSTTVTLRNRVP